MRVALLTLGTRGDVDPYIALGLGLKRAGHECWIVAPKNFAPRIREFGLPAFALDADFAALLSDPETRTIATGGMRAILREWRRTIVPLIEQSFAGLQQGALGAEALVYHPKAMVATDIAEALGIPAVLASPVPLEPTGAFPCPGVWSRGKGVWLNRMSYTLLRLQTAMVRGVHSRFRKKALGLGPAPLLSAPGHIAGKRVPRLYGVSPTILPRPADWPQDAALTGAWSLEGAQPWWPDEALATFLRAGEVPFYLGLGSMPVENPEALLGQVAEAAKLARVRVLVSAGWAGLEAEDMPEHLFGIAEAPHARLFPRMAGVLHHGGAGTTHAMFAAGKPGMALPVIADQPWWGERIAELGVGPRPLPVKKLTTAKLARALWLLKEREVFANRAREFGKRNADEDGVAMAVSILERIFA